MSGCAPGTYHGEGTTAYSVDYTGGHAGARSPGFYQLDLRGGYDFKLPANKTFEMYVDVIHTSE